MNLDALKTALALAADSGLLVQTFDDETFVVRDSSADLDEDEVWLRLFDHELEDGAAVVLAENRMSGYRLTLNSDTCTAQLIVALDQMAGPNFPDDDCYPDDEPCYW